MLYAEVFEMKYILIGLKYNNNIYKYFERKKKTEKHSNKTTDKLFNLFFDN